MNDNERVFTIFAGINGAGKTSLYRVLGPSKQLGVRVNIDEMTLSYGNWDDPKAKFHAGKEAMLTISDCIKNGVSFHLETTLGGSIYRHVKIAKENGFKIMLYFVGIDSVKLAIDRVHQRMANGGHGIADEYIIKRFSQLNANLKQLMPLCDGAILFDNTVRFRQIAILEDKRLIDCDYDLPYWFIDFLDEQPD